MAWYEEQKEKDPFLESLPREKQLIFLNWTLFPIRLAFLPHLLIMPVPPPPLLHHTTHYALPFGIAGSGHEASFRPKKNVSVDMPQIRALERRISTSERTLIVLTWETHAFHFRFRSPNATVIMLSAAAEPTPDGLPALEFRPASGAEPAHLFCRILDHLGGSAGTLSNMRQRQSRIRRPAGAPEAAQAEETQEAREAEREREEPAPRARPAAAAAEPKKRPRVRKARLATPQPSLPPGT